MNKPRDILNELKWRPGRDIRKARIWYIHRGAPGGTAIIDGSEIIEIKKMFLVTKRFMLPYHRIIKIEYGGRVIFEREPSQ